MTSKEIKELLKKNKAKENLALDTGNEELLTEVFKEYDILFNKLLRTQEKERLINLGVNRIRQYNRINTKDFEDIIENLKYYGLSFVDAQNQIVASYLYQSNA